MKVTSVRLDDSLMDKIDQMAELLARPRSWVISEAIRRFLDQEEWFHEAVREGVRAADEGRVVPHEEVSKWVESWGSKGEAKRPGK